MRPAFVVSFGLLLIAALPCHADVGDPHVREPERHIDSFTWLKTPLHPVLDDTQRLRPSVTSTRCSV
jgi:hypothetical protein